MVLEKEGLERLRATRKVDSLRHRRGIKCHKWIEFEKHTETLEAITPRRARCEAQDNNMDIR